MEQDEALFTSESCAAIVSRSRPRDCRIEISDEGGSNSAVFGDLSHKGFVSCFVDIVVPCDEIALHDLQHGLPQEVE